MLLNQKRQLTNTYDKHATYILQTKYFIVNKYKINHDF